MSFKKLNILISAPLWSVWQGDGICICNGTTGEGVTNFRRTCLEGTCEGSYIKTEPCEHCPVYTEWVAGECICDANSAAFALWSRSCVYRDTQEIAVNETACDSSELTKINACDASECPIWGTWGEWSECSVRCYDEDQPIEDRPEGHMTRVRNCTNGFYNDPSGACPISDAIEDELCEEHTGETIPDCTVLLQDEIGTVIKFYIDFKVNFAFMISFTLSLLTFLFTVCNRRSME